MSNHYAAVYQALDDAIVHCTCIASSEARIQRALAFFRNGRSDLAAVEQLERASIELYRLSVASLNDRRDERQAALERLRGEAERWMERLPLQ
jgi:hypothetical protein